MSKTAKLEISTVTAVAAALGAAIGMHLATVERRHLRPIVSEQDPDPGGAG